MPHYHLRVHAGIPVAKETALQSQGHTPAAVPEDQLLTLVLDGEGRFTAANSRLLELLGLDPSSYVGTPATTLAHPLDRDAAVEVFRHLRSEGAFPPFRIRARSVDGNVIPIAWSGVVLEDGTIVASGVPLAEEDAAGPAAEVLGPKGLKLDRRGRTVSIGDRPVYFTAAEFNILDVLLRDRGVVVPAADLAREAFGYDEPGLNWNFLQAHMSRIRKKLRPYGADNVIEAVRGIGYVCR